MCYKPHNSLTLILLSVLSYILKQLRNNFFIFTNSSFLHVELGLYPPEKLPLTFLLVQVYWLFHEPYE